MIRGIIFSERADNTFVRSSVQQARCTYPPSFANVTCTINGIYTFVYIPFIFTSKVQETGVEGERAELRA